MSESSSQSSGIGFLGALTILFIGLRLGGAIGWSWWWVLSPMWLPMVIAVVVGSVVWLDLQVGSVLDERRQRRNAGLH